jgi:hypothetical protein
MSFAAAGSLRGGFVVRWKVNVAEVEGDWGIPAALEPHSFSFIQPTVN